MSTKLGSLNYLSEVLEKDDFNDFLCGDVEVSSLGEQDRQVSVVLNKGEGTTGFSVKSEGNNLSVNAVDGSVIIKGREINEDVTSNIDDERKLVEMRGIKAFVNSSIQNIAAFYITKNISGDQFDSYSELTSTPSSSIYCGGKLWIPQRNDYCIVKEDETRAENSAVLPTSRYIYNPGVSAVSSEYDPSKWEFQYTINDSGFTQEQLNAIDSGITKQKVEKIDSLNSLSSINNNEIANYVRTNVSNPTIGLGAQIKHEVQKTVGYGDDVMLEAGTSRDLAYCGAFGSSAHIKNTNSDNSTLSNAFQIGRGINTVSDSLQFLSTQVVVDGKIPTDSLELKSSNTISLGKDAKGNEFGDIAIGIGANTTTASHAIAVGEQSKVYNLKHGGIALGFNAKVSAEYSCQIGGGTNNSVSSLQFLNTTVVNSDGKIPNASLELKSVNGLLSSDGNGNIDACDIEQLLNGKVDKKTNSVQIGNGAYAGSNSLAIGIEAETHSEGGYNNTAIGDYTDISQSIKAVAVGREAEVANANYACQLGKGKNTQVSSLQFLDTTVVNSEGVIPTGSLELTSHTFEMKFQFEDNTLSTLTIPYIKIA